MCLILLSYKMHPFYRMVFAANRDEYYDRPTLPLAFWKDKPDILGGRDLKRKGSWLGITRSGRIAAVTNFRESFLKLENAPSRGLLISDFLESTVPAKHYLNQIRLVGARYNGFNLIVGDGSDLFYYSNKSSLIQKLRPGIYGISNNLLNTPWPKVQKGKKALGSLLDINRRIEMEDLFYILADRSYPPDDLLPDTGVGYEWERLLSPLFITSPFYGTRSSSVIIREKTGRIIFSERTFEPEHGQSLKETTRTFSFAT